MMRRKTMPPISSCTGTKMTCESAPLTSIWENIAGDSLGNSLGYSQHQPQAATQQPKGTTKPTTSKAASNNQLHKTSNSSNNNSNTSSKQPTANNKQQPTTNQQQTTHQNHQNINNHSQLQGSFWQGDLSWESRCGRQALSLQRRRQHH